MKPQRIQRSRAKGWKMPPNTVYVGRPTRWGNPFEPARFGSIARCVNLYRRLMTGKLGPSGILKLLPDKKDNDFAAAIDLCWIRRPSLAVIRGKNLACWCPLDRPCHADVLLEIANR